MDRIIRAFRQLAEDPAYLARYLKQCIHYAEMALAFLLLIPFRKKKYAENLWLVTEKGTEARDNGYHFFRYVKTAHPEINIRYVISRDSADFGKVSPFGKPVILNSWKHFFCSLYAKASISSQAFGAMPEPPEKMLAFSKGMRRKDQILIFLQHGIIKDELPHTLDYRNTHYDLFCCSSEQERRFVQQIHGYPDENIKALGLCRFDNLLQSHEVQKQILVMPTFRMWLLTADAAGEATEKEKKIFEQSAFFEAYASLLTDESLLGTLRREGYRLVFYPHYVFQPYIGCFRKFGNDVVRIADRQQYDVQQLLMESSLLVTDFSSVFFDFAYMGKPEVFYQFDEEQYRGSHYKKGYFDYRDNGFGPVFTARNEVIREIVRQAEQGCVMDDEYRKRVDAFFLFRDTDNCRRTFEEIRRKAVAK